MVLFTSRSSLTWGNLHALHLASPPGIYPLSTLNNRLLTSFQRLYDDPICILCQQGRKVGEGYDASMGKSQYLPLPELPRTSVSYLWGTTFHQQPKNLGDAQEPCNDMAYLLVCAKDALEAQNYGMSLVWISLHQVRVSTMEEAVGTLSTYISSGPDWLYALTQLYQGSSHTPLPRDKHLGILPQGKAQESPYGYISQLKVCQLLSAGPQVIYPVGLNGDNKLVMITLPELLHSSASITANEDQYSSTSPRGTRAYNFTARQSAHHPSH